MIYYGWEERGTGKCNQRQKGATALRLGHNIPGKHQMLKTQPLYRGC